MQFRKTKISWYKQNRIIEHFIASTSAKTTSHIVNMPYKTIWHYFYRGTIIIAHKLEHTPIKPLTGEIEVDESYFGGRYKGKRGQGAENKTIVFGILQRGGCVYTHRRINHKKQYATGLVHINGIENFWR